MSHGTTYSEICVALLNGLDVVTSFPYNSGTRQETRAFVILSYGTVASKHTFPCKWNDSIGFGRRDEIVQ